MQTRFPSWETEIMAPVIRHIADGSDPHFVKEVAEEIAVFACPTCGHITPDHTWTITESGDNPCLHGTKLDPNADNEPCPCMGNFTTGNTGMAYVDDDNLTDEIRAVLEPLVRDYTDTYEA